MMHQSLTRFFPPPNFLFRPAVGLDLADRAIKYLFLVEQGGELFVRSFGEASLPAGAIVDGEIKKPSIVVQALRNLKLELETTFVIAAVPEEETYVIELTDLPPLPPREQRAAIELALPEYLPLPASDVTFDYEIFEHPTSRQPLVRAVVAPRSTVQAYTDAIIQAGYQPLALETEGRALARAYLSAAAEPTLLIDLGGTRTTFFILVEGRVAFSSTTKNISGEKFTAVIARSFQINTAEAEKLKIENGLRPMGSDQAAALWSAVTALGEEVAKVLNYWESSQTTALIRGVILAGGQATLPGLDLYLENQLKRPVAVGNPWGRLSPTSRYIPPLHFREALRFGTAVGLALRQFDD